MVFSSEKKSPSIFWHAIVVCVFWSEKKDKAYFGTLYVIAYRVYPHSTTPPLHHPSPPASLFTC